MLKKEYVEELYRCIEKNVEFTANLINAYVEDAELAAALENSFQDILCHFNRAYNPELVELKRRTRLYHKKWRMLKDTDKEMSNKVYQKYLELKRKVAVMEIPF